MRAKDLTLYSLPYVVGAASLMVAVYEVVPSFAALRGWSALSARSEPFAGHNVNRVLKGNRLPLRPVTPDKPGQDRPPAPSRTVVAAVWPDAA